VLLLLSSPFSLLPSPFSLLPSPFILFQEPFSLFGKRRTEENIVKFLRLALFLGGLGNRIVRCKSKR